MRRMPRNKAKCRKAGDIYFNGRRTDNQREMGYPIAST